jgi:hypothetical protein
VANAGAEWPARLTKQDFVDAALEIGVEPAALRAVADVESGGRGFLPDGRPKILFEGHVFWRELQKRGIDPVPLAVQHPTIVYKTWTRQHYFGGAKEYVRYETAKAINAEAAIASTSWGVFQMMGFNYSACGFIGITEFLWAHKESEREHLLAVSKWMRHNGLAKRLQAKDWEGFARGYNGPGYKQNRYDEKLATAYAKRVAEGWNA